MYSGGGSAKAIDRLYYTYTYNVRARRYREQVYTQWWGARYRLALHSRQAASRKLILTETPAVSAMPSAPTARPPSDTPYSPRPRLFDGLPLPDGPQASDVLTDADYRRMRTQAFSARSILPPLVGSIAVGAPRFLTTLHSWHIGYFSPKLFRTKAANIGIVRTGMFTRTSLSCLLSQELMSQSPWPSL